MAKKQTPPTPPDAPTPPAGGVGAEMPKYKCTKTVHALKIAKIEPHGAAVHQDGKLLPRGAVITPADAGFAPFVVDAAYMTKHAPVVGGYFVVYADGYKSFSPAQAFEEGYVRV